MPLPTRVTVVEVGPRDGLQNEARPVSVKDRVQLVRLLAGAGLSNIEVGAFVAAQKVPRMQGSAEVVQALRDLADCHLQALVPNLRGLEDAAAAGAREVSIFAAASESFSRANIDASVEQSLQRFAPVAELARNKNIKLRGYVSCALGCPFEGPVDPARVAQLAWRLADLGCQQISLADTIGVGTPGQVAELLNVVTARLPVERLAMHFHDTYGQALANTYVALERGVATFDASVAGLGGCPYAEGATGNLGTEDLLYMLDGLGIETGVDLDRLLASGRFICKVLGRAPSSRVATARA